MTFEIKSKHYFLTYPQYDGTTKELVYQYLLDFHKPSKILVAKELHQDGHDHYHVYMAFDKPLRVRDQRLLDINGQHGNYQGCRSPTAVLDYCAKKDDVISNFDYQKIIDKKRGKRAVIAEKLLKGEALKDVMLDHPELIFGYSRLKADLNAMQADMRTYSPFPLFLPNPWAKLIYFRKRSKRRHYWIYSRQPNRGKTTQFAIPLRDSYGAVIQTGDFQYWNVVASTRCIILDDYNSAKLKWSELNQLADGTFNFRVFHQGQLSLDNPLIIILSNVSLSELYPNMNQTLYARYIEIELQ